MVDTTEELIELEDTVDSLTQEVLELQDAIE
jgi:hypothetical protein